MTTTKPAYLGISKKIRVLNIDELKFSENNGGLI